MWGLHSNSLLEMKIVPAGAQEKYYIIPSPTVPVPTAAAALSPAPATIFTGLRHSKHLRPARPSMFLPLHSSQTASASSLFCDAADFQAFLLTSICAFTSMSNIPDASDTSAAVNVPESSVGQVILRQHDFSDLLEIFCSGSCSFTQRIFRRCKTCKCNVRCTG